jgi:uncharacterized SAM-binding protein YcdF (DUF218 family)
MDPRRYLPGRPLRILLTMLVVVLALFMLRYPLLRATGNFLISSDPLRPAKAMYVLGGAAIDRGVAAAIEIRSGMVPVAWCMGEMVPTSLEARGIMVNEGELTAGIMLREGAPEEKVRVIPIGTSTWDESLAILDHAMENRYDTITILTTDFHSRRVGMVFKRPFRREGIVVQVQGAPSSRYDNQQWWLTEEGLLMVNNEYVKLVYYLLKY